VKIDDKLIDSIIFQFANFHDTTELWKALRNDPDAYRNAVRHAIERHIDREKHCTKCKAEIPKETFAAIHFVTHNGSFAKFCSTACVVSFFGPSGTVRAGPGTRHGITDPNGTFGGDGLPERVHIACIRDGGTGPCACLDGCGACDSCGQWLGENDNA